MEPLSFLIAVPFILAIVTIKKYRWCIDFYYRKLAGTKKSKNEIELKAGIIASSIFVMLWSIIGFILINH
jgi:hypothetical protein